MSVKTNKSTICLESNGTLGRKKSKGSIADYLYNLSASQSQYSFSSTELFDDSTSFTRKRPGCRAPIASLECMEEGLLSSDSSVIFTHHSCLATPSISKRNLGKSGLRVSSLAFGAWSAFGSQLSEEDAEELVTLAYESGVNLFDTGDAYAMGKSEELLGKVFHKKEWRRSSYLVATKLFWGSKPEVESGLSRKHIIEAMKASLDRLQLNYVDIMIINKSDPMCPMEEIVRACTYCIDQGWSLYWGTSRWSTVEIMEAYIIARQFQLIPPTVEQAEYHMLKREKVEIFMPEIFHKIGVGCMGWCPPGFAIGPGKFDDGVQLLSKAAIKTFSSPNDKAADKDNGIRSNSSILDEVSTIAQNIGCTPTQLTIAWCLKNDNVQSVLIGPISTEQFMVYLRSLQVLPKITTAITTELEKVLDNKPVRTLPIPS